MLDLRELVFTAVGLFVGVASTGYVMLDQTAQAITDRNKAEDRLIALERNQTFASDQLRECKDTVDARDRKIAEYYSELHRRNK